MERLRALLGEENLNISAIVSFLVLTVSISKTFAAHIGENQGRILPIADRLRRDNAVEATPNLVIKVLDPIPYFSARIYGCG